MARLQTSRRLDPSVPMHRIVDAEQTRSGSWLLLDGPGGVVHVLDSNMEPVDRWGEGLLRQPTAMTISSDTGDLLVLDGATARIHRMDGTGTLIETIEADAVPGGLMTPSGLASAGNGDILVSDAGTHMVHRLSPAGSHLNSWGGKGIGHEEFWKPVGIVVDDQDRVIVLDHGNHRCQMFELDGTWLMTFGAGRAYTPSNRPPLDPKEPSEP